MNLNSKKTTRILLCILIIAVIAVVMPFVINAVDTVIRLL